MPPASPRRRAFALIILITICVTLTLATFYIVYRRNHSLNQQQVMKLNQQQQGRTGSRGGAAGASGGTIKEDLKMLEEVLAKAKDDIRTVAGEDPDEILLSEGKSNDAGQSNKIGGPERARLTMSETEDTIFVSVASFRDEVCGRMVKDMFAKAKTPSRIYVGIVEQHDKKDPSCIHDEFFKCQLDKFCPSDNIRIRRIEISNAKGPTFGRNVAMKMYRGEKYFMMLDSHNVFVENWDEKVISTLQGLINSGTSKKPVLSHYPEGWEIDNKDFALERGTTTHLCKAKFLDSGYLRFDGIVTTRAHAPKPQPFAAAGFLFADALLLHEVPFDPYLDLLFDGEEILYSVRMWTHGWDIFSPNQNIVYHYYYRKSSHKIWDHSPRWWEAQGVSVKRVQRILEVTHKDTTNRIVPDEPTAGEDPRIRKELDIYGLGKERTLAQYWEYAGGDPVKRTMTKNWC